MKKLAAASVLLMSASAAFAAGPESASGLVRACCAALAACCEIALGCCA